MDERLEVERRRKARGGEEKKGENMGTGERVEEGKRGVERRRKW